MGFQARSTERVSSHILIGRRSKNEENGLWKPEYTLESLNNLIDLYEARSKPEKAEEWREKPAQIEDFEEWHVTCNVSTESKLFR